MPLVWPSGAIEETQTIGVRDWQDDVLIVSKMDNGSFKSRRRTRLPRRFIEWERDLSGAERDALETFHDETLLNGSLDFNMQDPKKDETLAWRFVRRPAFELISGAKEPSPGWELRRWKCKIMLEETGPELV